MTLKSIIVEDEILATKSLIRLCQKVDAIDLVDSFENGKLALDYLKENSIDLIFLDIEMPELTGVQLLDQLKEIPQVIFTTSKKEYAYEAFEYDVTDFLIKPIEPNRFNKSIEKAIEVRTRQEDIANSSTSTEFYIRTDGKLTRVPYTDILYFENSGDYIKIITEKQTLVFHGALKTIDARIKHPRLLKVHRSFIINLDKIVDIEDNNVVIGTKMIPVSRAHKHILMQSINVLN